MEIENPICGDRGAVAMLLRMMKLITEQSAARRLAISIRKLRELVREEQIPHIPLPDGQTRFSESDLEDWVASRRKSVHASDSALVGV